MKKDNQQAAQDSEAGVNMSKKRDGNIQKAFRKEIDLSTKTIQSKNTTHVNKNTKD